MENLNFIIAKRLTELRKKNNLTQLQLDEKLSYSDKAFSKWENGESLPGVEVLCKLSELYNVSLDYIVGAQNPAKPPETPVTRKRRVSITLLSILVVWLAVTITYNIFDLVSGLRLWEMFCWAVPASFIIAIIFDCIWNNHKLLYLFASLLVWSLLICLSIQFFSYNIWQILFIGIPLQIGIFLWSKIMK